MALELNVNLLVVGDEGVGKRGWLEYLRDGEGVGNILGAKHLPNEHFEQYSLVYPVVRTIGPSFNVKFNLFVVSKMENFDEVVDDIHETIQDEFPELWIEGIILMYDNSNRTSFENLNLWYALVSNLFGQTKPMMCVANKMDLMSNVSMGKVFKWLSSTNIKEFQEMSSAAPAFGIDTPLKYFVNVVIREELEWVVGLSPTKIAQKKSIERLEVELAHLLVY